ncbi:hypothetical protein ONS96_001135 [Cadophora gregata f. sp. sojae]|nr:hypothetical protein ONS96_001135 [Cadophora gregata f. sp. sojae]
MQCSHCHSADYCSGRCENNDLPSHQVLCGEITDFISSHPKPSAKCVLALYFPILPLQQKGCTPEFIWFDGKNKVANDQVTGAISYVDCLADDDHKNPNGKGFEIFANYVKKFDFEHTVILYMRHAFRFDGSRVNLSLVETTKGQLSSPWGGPLVVYCRRGLSMDSNRVDREITLSDFRTFLDFCKVYGEGSGSMLKENMLLELEITNAKLFWSVLIQNSGGIAAKGVEISCTGDMTILGRRKYIGVDVAVNHPIWDTFNMPSDPTVVSGMIGVPLRIQRIYPDARFAGKGFDTMENDDARYLDIETVKTWRHWGMPDSGYTGQSGTGKIFGRVLVVREDMKDITPQQIEAIASFFRQEVAPKMRKAGNERLSKLSAKSAQIEGKKKLTDLVSRAKFEEFFDKFKAKKIKSGDTSWEQATVPEAIDGGFHDDSLTRVAQQVGGLSVSGLETLCG